MPEDRQKWFLIGFAAIFFATAGYLYFTKEETVEETPTYVATSTPAILGKSYTSPTYGFSSNYPDGFAIAEDYQYRGLGAGREIKGISFTPPATFFEGTNLSSDTAISIEVLPEVAASACDPALFFAAPLASSTPIPDAYRYARMETAGAGNFYDERVYTFEDHLPCTAVRYFIHSTNIANYEPGAVRPFDEAALLRIFDSMRGSIMLPDSL